MKRLLNDSFRAVLMLSIIFTPIVVKRLGKIFLVPIEYLEGVTYLLTSCFVIMLGFLFNLGISASNDAKLHDVLIKLQKINERTARIDYHVLKLKKFSEQKYEQHPVEHSNQSKTDFTSEKVSY